MSSTNDHQEDRDSSQHDVESHIADSFKHSTTVDAEQNEKSSNVVGWEGPDDPENPMNWSTSKKVIAIGIVSFITTLSPLASTIISPAASNVLMTFDSTSVTLGSFVTSVYLLGYCFGPLVIAPLSELYGRLIPYNTCNFMFLVFSIACAVAPNLSALIVFRFFAGTMASCPVALGAGTIADMIHLEQRGLAMSFWIMGPLVGPAVGPLIGAYLALAKGWRWIFWLLSIVAGAAFVVTLCFMRESYPHTILQKKTRRMQRETGNYHLRSVLETDKGSKALFKFSIVRPVKLLFLSPIVFLMALYIAILNGYLFLMFTTFPRVFENQYGFSKGTVGLVYLGAGVGSFIGLFFCGSISDKLVSSLTRRNNDVGKPEYRLPGMFAGALLVPIGLFLYGWTAEKKLHWILPIVGTGFLGAGIFIIFMLGSTYLIDAYTAYAASVSAAATVFRSLMGALLPLAGNAMYDALEVGWGNSLLGFIAVAFIPVPVIFWRYGQNIRESNLFRIEF